MTLICEEIIEGIPYRIWEGIDFQKAKSHPDDGSEGFMVILLQNWKKDVEMNKREAKINSILTGEEYKDLGFSDVENNFVLIYQKDNIDTDQFIEILKNKWKTVGNGTWLSHSLNSLKGAWNLKNSKITN